MKQTFLIPILSNFSDLFIFRVTEKGIRWRTILKEMGVVIRQHGGKKKDIYAVDGYRETNPEDKPILERLQRAYGGDPDCLPGFYLYAWQDGHFIKIRDPRKESEQ